MTPFLKQVAVHYLAAGDISSRRFIFPNRRSQVFFKKYLGEAVAASQKPLAPVPATESLSCWSYMPAIRI